jgi:diacylglycerol O-acyltransferase
VDPQTSPARPRRVHGVDAAFLHNETRTSPWHIVGVLVFDPSTAPGGFGAEVLRRVIAGRIHEVEAFRRRVVDVRGAMSVPHWVLDATVDVTEHVRRAAVPGLEGLAALARLAADTARFPLPRDRPLWQIDVIDDLGDGRVGVVAKVHHSIMDGAAAVGILGALFDLEPLAAAEVPAEPDVASGDQGLGVGQVVRTLARAPGFFVRAVTRVPGATQGLVHALRDAGRSVTLPLSAPRTRLNRSITSRRDVALTALPRADLQEVAGSFDLKLNDVVMVMCAGALRDWLGAAGDLPDRPLVAAVPVAVGGVVDHRSGNNVSVMFAALPTDRPDPGARIEAVRREMRDAKATQADVGPTTMSALAEAAPWNVVGLLFRAYSDLGLANRLPPAVNLVISNVPGPPVPVYCGGARLMGLYPLGPIFDGVALNITVATCGDDVDVGIVTCPDVAPSAPALANAIRRSLAELVALARVPSRTEA